MSAGSFRSASGLRPTTAFFGVAIVLVVVLVRAVALAVDGRHAPPRRISREVLPEPDFDIVDAQGRTLARSVQRLDLVLSPRAMWQAHTPEKIGAGLAAALDGRGSAEEMLARMLPDAEHGVIRVDDEFFRLDFDAARRVQSWLGATGLEGLWLERASEPGRWTVCWEPAVLLSEATRQRHGGERTPGPLRWGRRLALDLARCVLGERAVQGEGAPAEALQRQHDRIWRALMPCADQVVEEGLGAGEASRVAKMLDKEGVDPHQMHIGFHHQRRYPVREGGAEQDFAILGGWRYIDRGEALALACAEHGYAGPQDCPEELRGDLDHDVAVLLDHKHPRSGLEGLASALLEDDAWSFAAGSPAVYRFRKDWPAHGRARRYYVADQPEGATPRVVTTLDSGLQVFLRHALEDLIDEHDPALAMGIAVDVESGDVLAVDGLSPYEVSGFLPTWHLFTPGSTFKVLVMSLALDQGVVTPLETFNTFDGNFPVPGSGRVIHEAEGPPGGWREAREGLAHSINALLVQIGMRIPQEVFHDRLVALGYGSTPRAGVGDERSGSVPELPWHPAYAQASVSFGHELSVSLWQHAAGLATVARGGGYKPLRLISGVEHEGRRYAVETPDPEPLIAADACEEVRRMMVLGAEIGTGRHLWKRELEAGTPLWLATKTGTAEKVPSEVCLHLELERNERNAGLTSKHPDFEPFTALAGRPKPHGRRACYTSSIVAVGRVPGTEREVMVLVVVDEPRGKAKFGSEVAGPTAIAVLKEALGLTRGGRAIDSDGRIVPPTDYDIEANPWERPWEATGTAAVELEESATREAGYEPGHEPGHEPRHEPRHGDGEWPR